MSEEPDVSYEPPPAPLFVCATCGARNYASAAPLHSMDCAEVTPDVPTPE